MDEDEKKTFAVVKLLDHDNNDETLNVLVLSKWIDDIKMHCLVPSIRKNDILKAIQSYKKPTEEWINYSIQNVAKYTGKLNCL